MNEETIGIDSKIDVAVVRSIFLIAPTCIVCIPFLTLDLLFGSADWLVYVGWYL